MTLFTYSSADWWETVTRSLPASVGSNFPLLIELVDEGLEVTADSGQASRMTIGPNTFDWRPGSAERADLRLIRPRDIGCGDVLARLAGSDIVENTIVMVDGIETDILGVAGRGSKRWIGLKNATGAVKIDIINSPFGDLTLYLCVYRGDLRVSVHPPAAIDGLIKLEYVRLLPFTTGQCSYTDVFDQYDDVRFDLAVMSTIEACLSDGVEAQLSGTRLCEVLTRFSAVRTSPMYKQFVDDLDALTT